MNVINDNPTEQVPIWKSNPALLPTLRQGDLVEGVVLEKSPKAIVIDLGRYGTGMVYRGELQNARDIARDLEVGSPVHAKVVEADNDDGLVELSLSEADKQRAWAAVAETKEKDEAIKIKPTGFNKGGLMVDIEGLHAFLPVSQLSAEHYPHSESAEPGRFAQILQTLVGVELEVKIIDVNPRTGKLIVSERAAQEISAKELAKSYSVGQEVEGVVSGVADFGAFIRFTDNPAVEGFIHVSEIAHRVLEHPKEVIKLDDVVKAKIVDIKDGRISLSLKALKEDPWLTAAENYKEGEVVKGSVYSFTPFGALVNLEHGLQGQLPVTDFGGVAEMKKALVAGDAYPFTVLSVKPEDHRIMLKFQK
jgi:small subunit ribosomal protein S1